MTTDELREKFEAYILKRVVGTPCEPYKDSMLNRLPDDSYEQSWVDMQWEGYQAAHEELQGEIDALRKDKERLDFIEATAKEGLRWVFRESNLGRGKRLHQDVNLRDDQPLTARGAIDSAMNGQKQEEYEVPAFMRKSAKQ